MLRGLSDGPYSLFNFGHQAEGCRQKAMTFERLVKGREGIACANSRLMPVVAQCLQSGYL